MSEKEPNPGESRNPKEIARNVKEAAQLMKEALEVRRHADEVASRAIFATFASGPDQTFLIDIPPDAEGAYIVREDQVISDGPREFVATEVRSIGPFGMEFYNVIDDTTLRFKTFDFEITPTED